MGQTRKVVLKRELSTHNSIHTDQELRTDIRDPPHTNRWNTPQTAVKVHREEKVCKYGSPPAIYVLLLALHGGGLC